MSEFEDNLWLEIVREHGQRAGPCRAAGPQAKTRDPPPAARRHHRRSGRNRGRDRVAVQRVDQPRGVRGYSQPDGTVTVNLMQAIGDRRGESKACRDGGAGTDRGAGEVPAEARLPGWSRADDHI